ncbi:aminoglycoside phosphotransferase family protein [Legionella cherrii]|uniref:Spectinomycin phosphotransferase n=1 Tax=Legionella cherrii TaxID=28084 RepID=A0ABY6T7B8_9GAMM|nr:aminoglycoside phosphotransferase family protein [Legionella cherrii]VEB37575.1 spectinomycin phosphotransferase [Legionella cherrii]
MPGQPIPKQQLIELLKNHYAISAKDILPLQLGADMSALVYKVNASPNSYFLKLKYGNHEETHMDVIKLLHDSHVKEIIFPVSSIDGKLIKQLNDFKMIVYPFIEGFDGFQLVLTKNQWIKLGKTLKQIHTLSIPLALRKSLRKEMFSPKWREMVKSLYSQIESDTSTNKMTIDFKRYYRKQFASIYRLVNSAEELVKKIQFDAQDYVLCHADIHAGNILMSSDESFYIIDWDDPMMAPKERDLMFIGGGVGNVWNLPAEVAYFYEGYGEVVINKTILSYYRHERIIEDIALYGLDLLSSNQSDHSKRVSLEHFKSMFEPNGVVDIAFQGLE